MIVDKSGIYPRTHFIQGANPEEIGDWYDFGSIGHLLIFLKSKDYQDGLRMV